MAAKAESLPVYPHQVYRADRSKSKPKHTLFGSGLEQLDENDLEQIRRIRVNPPRKNSQKLSPALEKQKREFEAQKLAQQKAYSDLKTMHQKALGFSSERMVNDYQSRRGSCSARPHQWYKPDDLHHAREINRVGLNSRQSFNYDKYGTKPPVHKYALIGDVMRSGMDFTMPDLDESVKQSLYWRNKNMSCSGSKNGGSTSGTPSSSQKNIVDLPVNIKHHFGTKVCDSLLSNEKLVNETLAQQQGCSSPLTKVPSRDNVSPLNPKMSPSYESLGNTTRQNIFPGYSMYYTKSLAKSSYSDDVHTHRVPPPDKFRYQRDELSVWSQQNFLRAKLKKKWDDFVASLPKAAVNWDRSAKRDPVVRLQPDIQKPKPKTKPLKPRKIISPKEQAFEEVMFETPPLTPPPPTRPSPEKLPDYVKDEEFWEFFDQPVP